MFLQLSAVNSVDSLFVLVYNFRILYKRGELL